MIVSSRANERVKAIRALREKKERDATGTFFAEGQRLLRAALDTDAEIELVICAPERLTEGERAVVQEALARGVHLLEVTPDVFDGLAFREEAQSVGAIVKQRWETLAPTTRGERCFVALHDIQHPGNLGTVIRTCDAIGGDGVILSGSATDPYHPVAVRGSLGAIFSQRIIRATPDEFAAWAGSGAYKVVGTTPAGDRDYRQVDYASKPVVLIMGSERIGISDDQARLCDALIRIPMGGYVESLNLSIAAALVLYEVYRQQAPLA
jgi:TrmH family RNA methyltransferase